MKTISILLLLSMLVGCAAPNPNRRSDGALPYQVAIETNEPGAKIEVDGEYQGDSPCIVTVWGDDAGRFKSGGSFVVFRAIPVKDGQFSQSKSFISSNSQWNGAYIPKKIYFNMNLGPAEDRNMIDVNIIKW